MTPKTPSATIAPAAFTSAIGEGRDWREAAKSCLARLGHVEGANFGVLYITDALADQAVSIITLARGVTGIANWVGTVGLGVIGGDQELFDRPAIAILAGRLPDDGFRVFPAVDGDLGALRRAAGGWLDRFGASLALVHADPRDQNAAQIVAGVGEETGAFVVGGLSASRGAFVQFQASGQPLVDAPAGLDPVVESGVSGALFAPSVAVATGLSQGCAPIGPTRVITAADENVILEIDGRPALEVFKEDIGEELAEDLTNAAGTVFAGLPITGSDTGDYLVRNLVAIDARTGWLAIAEGVGAGQRIVFTRRDRASAEADLRRMLNQIKRRLSGPPKAAIYISCVARGPNLFGEDGREVKMIQEELGPVPLVGFFAGGEISHARLYGYTGVLTLFL